MANEASNKIKYLLATKKIDFLTDVFKIILVGSGFVFNKDTHETYANVSGSELPTANGYTVGGNVLTGVAVNEDDVDDRTEITWANTSWTATGGTIGPARGAIIYDDTVASPSKPIVMYIDFGADYSQAAGGVATISNIELRIS